MKWRGLVLIAGGLAIFTLLGVGFYYTGGRGLLRIIPNYLMADIPDNPKVIVILKQVKYFM